MRLHKSFTLGAALICAVAASADTARADGLYADKFNGVFRVNVSSTSSGHKFQFATMTAEQDSISDETDATAWFFWVQFDGGDMVSVDRPSKKKNSFVPGDGEEEKVTLAFTSANSANGTYVHGKEKITFSMTRVQFSKPDVANAWIGKVQELIKTKGGADKVTAKDIRQLVVDQLGRVSGTDFSVGSESFDAFSLTPEDQEALKFIAQAFFPKSKDIGGEVAAWTATPTTGYQKWGDPKDFDFNANLWKNTYKPMDTTGYDPAVYAALTDKNGPQDFRQRVHDVLAKDYLSDANVASHTVGVKAIRKSTALAILKALHTLPEDQSFHWDEDGVSSLYVIDTVFKSSKTTGIVGSVTHP